LFFSVLLLTITTLIFYCSSCYAHYDNLLFYVLHFCSTTLLPCWAKTLLRSCWSTAILVCCSFIVQHLLTAFMLHLLAKFYPLYKPCCLLLFSPMLYCSTDQQFYRSTVVLRCFFSVILVYCSYLNYTYTYLYTTLPCSSAPQFYNSKDTMDNSVR
jgi:hypothetical protein